MITTHKDFKIFRYEESNAGFDLYVLLFVRRVSAEPIVLNVLKFDILLPEIVLAIGLQVFFDILDVLSISGNLDEIMI